jgi:hypothetical protein
MKRWTAVMLAGLLAGVGQAAEQDGLLRAGWAEIEITPPLDGERPVYLAGFGMNRKARGVHDPLMARAVVLDDGRRRLAIVSVDLVGLQYPTVQAIRERLAELAYVLVASTHNHQGPDVIGIWGRGPLHRGVDDAYLADVVEKVVLCVRQAAQHLESVQARYGTARDETLLHDTRLPIVKDGVLRVVRFDAAGRSAPAGLVVQWNCHPESLGRENRRITADFPWATVAALGRRYGCPVVYLSGAIGGLMTNPPTIQDEQGQELAEGTFDYARVYGEKVARLAEQAIDQAQPIALVPLEVYSQRVAVPVDNALYRAARAVGVVQREALVYRGDWRQPGPPMTVETSDRRSAVLSEVAYLKLGALDVACIPGELYPELVYGDYPPQPEAGVDFPEAACEMPVAQILPQARWLLVGLANDELGYIIPKRQWDKSPPYAYGKENGQYGEINSCGPDVAPILMDALKACVAQAAGAGR